jgi:hypothetical protein
MSRREYSASIIINGLFISRIVIDPHYEKKHAESINDDIILGLVQMLNGSSFEPVEYKHPFVYFMDNILLNKKKFKLIWLMEIDKNYIGIINAYRS